MVYKSIIASTRKPKSPWNSLKLFVKNKVICEWKCGFGQNLSNKMFSTNINISNKKLVSLVAKGSLSDNQFIIFYLMIGVGEDTVDHVE